MKILFFSHGKRANGGAERCLLDLVKGLKQARESWEDYIDFPRFASLLQSFDQVQQTSFRTAVRPFSVRKEENLHVRFHFIFRVRR